MADTVVLSSPSSHTVYVDADGELYGGPLAGTIRTSNQTLKSLQVALIRTIQLNPNASMTAARNSSRLKTRLSLRKPKHSPKSTPSASFVQEPLRCNLSTTPASSSIHPDGLVTHDFSFALPSPLHSPETILSGTILEVSYELVVTATALDGQTLTDSRPLRLIRRRLPDPWDFVTHMRSFPKSNVKLELALVPQLSESGQCTHYTGDIKLCNVALPGTRPSELTALAVENLSWRLDEIITLDTKTSESTTTQTRNLVHSSKKGRWTTFGNRDLRSLLSEQAFGDMAIAIPLEINIGKDNHAINDIDISGPNSPSLTVRHQVTIELVTGRETISRDTGSLVARRSSIQGFGATISVPLHSYADATDFLEMMDADSGLLPGYEKVTTAPPEYKEVVEL